MTAHTAGQIISVVTVQVVDQPAAVAVALAVVSEALAAPVTTSQAQTAHALQYAAADTAALLQQRADILGQPARIDYPTEIKQWRVLADQAGQMAERWEQRP